MKPLTLQEAKDQVAKKHGWTDWWSIDFNRSVVGQETMRDEAAELYAQSQVNEALDKAIELSKDFVKNAYRYQLEGRNYIEELKRLKR